MKYTENYHLPQWVATDRIMRKDFNTAMSNIESGMSANAQAAAQAAKLPYVVGSYAGNGDGTAGQEIRLGFRPSFVIICSDQQYQTQTYYGGNGVMMAGPTGNTGLLYLTDNGFRVVGDDRSLIFPQINHSKWTYDYIAFR